MRNASGGAFLFAQWCPPGLHIYWPDLASGRENCRGCDALTVSSSTGPKTTQPGCSVFQKPGLLLAPLPQYAFHSFFLSPPHTLISQLNAETGFPPPVFPKGTEQSGKSVTLMMDLYEWSSLSIHKSLFLPCVRSGHPHSVGLNFFLNPTLNKGS